MRVRVIAQRMRSTICRPCIVVPDRRLLIFLEESRTLRDTACNICNRSDSRLTNFCDITTPHQIMHVNSFILESIFMNERKKKRLPSILSSLGPGYAIGVLLVKTSE